MDVASYPRSQKSWSAASSAASGSNSLVLTMVGKLVYLERSVKYGPRCTGCARWELDCTGRPGGALWRLAAGCWRARGGWFASQGTPRCGAASARPRGAPGAGPAHRGGGTRWGSRWCDQRRREMLTFTETARQMVLSFMAEGYEQQPSLRVAVRGSPFAPEYELAL